jgi:DNA (cytosine-5)-methyltransferase 1
MVATVISLFAGCGGSSLGYRRANCKVLLAVDFELNATKTYRLNFKTKTLTENVRVLHGNQLKEIASVQDVDILDGSPPCTPFSLAGKRERGWNKTYVHSGESKAQQTNDLFFEFIRLVRETNPKAFIAENVKGLIIGAAKGYYNRILKEMRKLNYYVESYCLNAKYYGVPQARERIIFIGFRKDLKLNGTVKLKRGKTIMIQDVLNGIISPKDETAKAFTSFNNSTKREIYRKMKQGESCADYDNGTGFNILRLKGYGPSNTITTHTNQLIHPTEDRFITLTEAKILQSFPSDFKFISKEDGYKRIGNSVPPNLIRHVAEYVIAKLDL